MIAFNIGFKISMENRLKIILDYQLLSFFGFNIFSYWIIIIVINYFRINNLRDI